MLVFPTSVYAWDVLESPMVMTLKTFFIQQYKLLPRDTTPNGKHSKLVWGYVSYMQKIP